MRSRCRPPPRSSAVAPRRRCTSRSPLFACCSYRRNRLRRDRPFRRRVRRIGRAGRPPSRSSLLRVGGRTSSRTRSGCRSFSKHRFAPPPPPEGRRSAVKPRSAPDRTCLRRSCGRTTAHTAFGLPTARVGSRSSACCTGVVAYVVIRPSEQKAARGSNRRLSVPVDTSPRADVGRVPKLAVLSGSQSRPFPRRSFARPRSHSSSVV